MAKAKSKPTTPRHLDPKSFALRLPHDEAILIPLYQTFRAMSDASQLFYNMPRTTDDAADLIEEETQRADSLACAIAERLRSLPSVKSFWQELLAEVLISHDFFTGANMNDVLSTVAYVNSLPTNTRKPGPDEPSTEKRGRAA